MLKFKTLISEFQFFKIKSNYFARLNNNKINKSVLVDSKKLSEDFDGKTINNKEILIEEESEQNFKYYNLFYFLF